MYCLYFLYYKIGYKGINITIIIIMNKELQDICNNNSKNMPSDNVYDTFNKFIFSDDTKLIGKFLHRYKYF